jgi:uncharacterized protein (TIGR00288 family)
MNQNRETNLALFIDFDNIALGARDAKQRFDVQLLLQRVLEKGKIVVKRAYADWHYHKQYMAPLHEAAIELIEVPAPKISGKNSADIRLVVDALDLCYSKHHIDMFVIVSGDSDFSPLVSKLRENNKQVLGIGMRNSSSNLLIANCDEFIFYDDIYGTAIGRLSPSTRNVPADKRELFEFLLTTAQSLLQESRGVLYSSLIKDTMKRKRPDFNESGYGYATFGDLLDDASKFGLLTVRRDEKAGGTWVVQGLGPDASAPPARSGGRSRRSSRRRRREKDKAAAGAAATDTAAQTPSESAETPRATGVEAEKRVEPEAPEPAKKAAKKPAKKAAKKPAKKTGKKTAKKSTKKAAKKAAKKTAKKTSKKAAGKKPAKAAKRTTKKKTDKAATKSASEAAPAATAVPIGNGAATDPVR